MKQKTKISAPVFSKIIDSPMGPLLLTASQEALLSLNWLGSAEKSKQELSSNKILDAAEIQLQEYFAGRRKEFKLPLAPQGTVFQQKAWAQLVKIPYGRVISYGEQAKRMGQPQAQRAVGGANGKNPIAIIIPCHRVVGSNGSLTGFSSGLPRKEKLLQIEGVLL